jgi:uncharacterized protein YyaL (SSP411 family)
MAHVLGGEGPRGMLDDSVQAAAAFLDAYEATGEDAWLSRAETVMAYCARTHWDDAAGGFWDLAPNRDAEAYLASRAKPGQDAPTPSANGVAALVLARLAAITEKSEWRDRRDAQVAAFAGSAAAFSLHGATLLRALDWAVHPVTRIEVAGPLGPGAACAMHLQALQSWRPRRIVLRRTASAPAATVCVGTTCSLPVASTAALGALLA